MSSLVHAVTSPHEPILIHGASRSFYVHQVPAASDNLCWLIEYEPQRVALVDGPGASEVLSYLSQRELTLTHILNTHTHGDHIGVNRALEAEGLLSGLEVWGSASAPVAIPGLTRSLSDGDTVQLGSLEGVVLLTEGHLNGHISFVFGVRAEEEAQQTEAELALFCGDTLFTGGCGYVFDGPMSVMAQSLSRLARLGPNTQVFCAHEYTLDNLHFALSVEPGNHALLKRAREVTQLRSEGRSTVPSRMSSELQTNPFLRESPELRSAVGAGPHEGQVEVFERARRLKNSKAYRARSMEALLSSLSVKQL